MHDTLTEARAIAAAHPPLTGPTGRRWRAMAAAVWCPSLDRISEAEAIPITDRRIRTCAGVVTALVDSEGDSALDILWPHPSSMPTPIRWQWEYGGWDWVASAADLSSWSCAAMDALVDRRRHDPRREQELSVWSVHSQRWIACPCYGMRRCAMPGRSPDLPGDDAIIAAMAPLWYWTGAWSLAQDRALSTFAGGIATDLMGG